MPVGQDPLELMPQQLTGGAGTCIQVVIDGEKWVAVRRARPIGKDGERELHGDYPFDQSIQGSFYAALLMSGAEGDFDVGGLACPVSQYMDVERREVEISV